MKLPTAPERQRAQDGFRQSTLDASRFEPPGADGPPTAARPRARSLRMKHPVSGASTIAPLGYSLPVALLGPLPLLWRRSWGLAALILIATVLLPLIGQVLLASRVNKLHIQHLLRRGYRAMGRFPGEVSAIEWNLQITLPRYRGPQQH